MQCLCESLDTPLCTLAREIVITPLALRDGKHQCHNHVRMLPMLVYIARVSTFLALFATDLTHNLALHRHHVDGQSVCDMYYPVSRVCLKNLFGLSNNRSKFNANPLILMTNLQKAYKDWLCAVNLPYYMNGERIKPCISFCERVEQRCPYLHPIVREQYGGQPVFICRGKY